jgi:hypothetical protein
VVDDRPEHDPEYNYPDGYAPPENLHMKIIGISTDLGYALGHVKFPGCLKVRAKRHQRSNHQA